MWADFGLTLNSSLAWLQRRWLVAAVFGAIGGPLAYLAGVRIGAVSFSAPPAIVYAALALVWGVVTPALLGIAERFADEKKARPSAAPR
jgi:hypothetical protein